LFIFLRAQKKIRTAALADYFQFLNRSVPVNRHNNISTAYNGKEANNQFIGIPAGQKDLFSVPVRKARTHLPDILQKMRIRDRFAVCTAERTLSAVPCGNIF
jgi:hypothetical protein